MIRNTLPRGTRIKVSKLRGFHKITEVIPADEHQVRSYRIEGHSQPVEETLIRDVIERSPLIVIIGRTASGKDTLAEIYTNPLSPMAKSYTTRPRRYEEGDTHIFIDDVEAYDDRWVETQIGDYRYFMTKEQIEDSGVITVDPCGFYSLVERMEQEGMDRELDVYYLMVDEHTRRKRYLKRDQTSNKEFNIRDLAENEQFARFEKKLRDEDFCERYNIEVRTSETGPRGHATYSEIEWLYTPHNPFIYGMWKKKVYEDPYQQAESVHHRERVIRGVSHG